MAQLRNNVFRKSNKFPGGNEREILNNPGKVGKEVADKLALEPHGIYHQHRLARETRQEALHDDKELKQIQNKIQKGIKKKFFVNRHELIAF